MTTARPGPSPTLTGLDVEAFTREGYVPVPDFLSDAQLRRLRGWMSEIEAWPADGDGWFQHDELGERGVVRTRTENFSPFHDGLRALLTTGALPAMAGQLLGEPAVLYKEKVNYKHPGGAGFATHQDAPAYPHLPVSVSCLLAVDDATVENGCLELAAGMHQQLLPTDDDGCVRPDITTALTFRSLPVCQPPLGMTTECRVCAVELADPVWFGRVVLTVFVGAVTVTIFGSG
ncbi:phytanoyl-CoA dioxygenase family protein [Pseudonocardia sp. Cha107L01]|uniref:phytanoyl-CoA dioxygenase family protein n=1 Tax=Pseudonocardia sp. Cha107L01 TaxID=3457576 RepID=UPI00403EC727